jgi:hypothetical protein
MRVWIALLLALRPAAAEDYDPTEVLVRLRDRVLAHGEQAPNHTCVETITRDRYEAPQPAPKTCDAIVARRNSESYPATLRLATTDRLRLDVLLAGGRELMSWAGAGKFEDREIDELVPDGAIGTGPFATMLLGVFRGRPPRFTYEGETTIDHRLVFEYSYRVPREASQYRVKSGKEWLPTGYTGTLWVDVKTAELARLAVRTDELEPASGTCETHTTLDHRLVFEYSYRVLREESQYRVKAGKEWLPTGYTGRLWVDVKTAELARLAVRTDELEPASGTCETHTTLEYGAVKLGEFEYFLPRATRQRFIGRDGSEAENRIEFASCREYRGESKVSFGGGIADVEKSASGPRVAAASFPPGLPVIVETTGTIHSNRAAAGDVIHGRLAQSIGNAVAAGTTLEGRLMRVELRHGSRPEVVITLRWETIEIGGTKAPIFLRPDRRISNLKALNERVGLARRGIEIELPPPGDLLHGVYHFPGQQVVVESGFRTEWTTVR